MEKEMFISTVELHQAKQMSAEYNSIYNELRAMREEMNNAMELLAIASTGKKDCSDELNDIIQAALPFVRGYNAHADFDRLDDERFLFAARFKDVRRLIAAISKVTDGDLK